MRHAKRRAGATVLIGLVMAGCGGPGGTVKADGDEYAKAVKATESLARDAADLIRETSDGTDGEAERELGSEAMTKLLASDEHRTASRGG